MKPGEALHFPPNATCSPVTFSDTYVKIKIANIRKSMEKSSIKLYKKGKIALCSLSGTQPQTVKGFKRPLHSIKLAFQSVSKGGSTNISEL